MNVKRLLTLAVFFPVMSFAAEVVPPIPTLPPLPSAAMSAHPVTLETALPSVIPLQTMVQKSKGDAFDLRFATVSFVVDFVYENAVKTPHVIAPEVLADQRVVSFRYKNDAGDLRVFLADFLGSLGYVIVTRNGVDFIGKRPEEMPERQQERAPFVYMPRYRKADYLMRMVQPLVGGKFTTQRTVVAPSGKGAIGDDVPQQSAAAQIDQTSDQLVFLGLPAEVAALKQVLPMIDTPRGRVALRGWVYEVTDASQNQSGMSLALSILGSAVSVNNGFADPTSSVIHFRAGNAVDLAIQALDSDSRFKVLTRPSMTVLSGEKARLNVGQQVPTQGNITYQGTSGTPVQSVVYQDAGVIFDVEPTVMADTIEVTVDEEISDFVRTTTGVNTSPTKNTRKLQTVTALADGDVAVIGGLIQSHDSKSTSGLSFLPKWANGHNDSKDRTEVVLVLQVTKI